MRRITNLTGIGLAVLMLAACGCGRKPGGAEKEKPAGVVISNGGSDTLVNLAQMWAEEYRKVVPGVSVEVSGGGSGVGIRDLAQGIVDIANASRDLTESERQQMKTNTGKLPVETTVAFDGIAIYVHKDNPVDVLTVDQLAAIFGEGGQVDKWSQLGVDLSKVGGKDEIVRVSRQNSSGTYVFFREHILNKKDFKMGSRDMSGSKDVVELVGRTPGAIGYSGMGYNTDAVKIVKIAAKDGEPGVAPTPEAVIEKKYSLARPLLMLTLGAPEGAVKAYLEWICSDAGQKIVEQAGDVPIRSTAAK